jgi:hypothetical protein
VVVAAALAAMGIISTSTEPSNPAPRATSVVQAGLGGESTAMYCGGLENVQGKVASDIAIADLASTARAVEVTTTNQIGQVAHLLIAVHPGLVRLLNPASMVDGSVEAVSLVARGGGVAATEAVRGTNGTAVAPCLTRAAPSWWLTGGSTHKGQSFILSIFNPYASTAVVSVTLQTPSGTLVPQVYQGIVLGPHQLAALNVHRVEPDDSPVTAIVTASQGDVVVYGVGRSTTGGASTSLLPGNATLARTLYLPVGHSLKGWTNQLLVSNPGFSPTQVSVAVRVPSVRTPSGFLAPFTFTVAGRSTAVLTTSPSSRVPLGVPTQTRISSTPGGVVVVQRVTTASTQGQNVPIDDPAASASTGLALVNPLGSSFSVVGVMNLSDATMHLTVRTMTPHGEVQVGHTYAIAPRGSIRLGPGALRGVVGGVVLLGSDQSMSASGEVQGALIGSDILVAAPLG